MLGRGAATLLTSIALVSCKPIQTGQLENLSTATSPTTAKPPAFTCTLNESDPSIKRLLEFRHKGVQPYLGCPYYMSEWAVYPSFKLQNQNDVFQQWFKTQFQTLERLSSLAGKEYFADRYELYTVVMGEGLPFLFDIFSPAAQVVTDEDLSQMQTLAQKHQNTPLVPYMHELTQLKVIGKFEMLWGHEKQKMHMNSNVVMLDAHRPKTLQIDLRNLPINGFGVLGVDWFGAEYPKLKSAKYSKPYLSDLRPGIDFSIAKAINERGEQVQSANFRNLEIGLKAFVAVYLERRNMFIEDSKRYLGYVPDDPEVRMYWTYYYYRRPAEALQKLRQQKAALHVPVQGEDGLRPKMIPLQCLKRIATRAYLSRERVLD